jgi:hypothetical protein
MFMKSFFASLTPRRGWGTLVVEVTMARRAPAQIICTMLDRDVHARLRTVQKLLDCRTLSDALDKALRLLESADFKTIATLREKA